MEKCTSGILLNGYVVQLMRWLTDKYQLQAGYLYYFLQGLGNTVNQGGKPVKCTRMLVIGYAEGQEQTKALATCIRHGQKSKGMKTVKI